MVPVFIGGTGRSGTTILRRTLAHHPDVTTIPKELRLFTDPGGVLDLTATVAAPPTPYHLDAAVARFLALLRAARTGTSWKHAAAELTRRAGRVPPRYTNLRFDAWFGKETVVRARDRLLEELGVRAVGGSWIGSAPAFRRAILYEGSGIDAPAAALAGGRFITSLFAGRRPGAAAFVEDTPGNLLRFDSIRHALPGARLIHVYRDPLDVVASYRTKRWGGGEPRIIAAKIGGMLASWNRIRAELSEGKDYIEVDLYDLCSEPRQVLTRICEFSGITPNEAVLSRTFDQPHQGRWKQDLTAEEVESCRAILSASPAAPGS